MSIILTFLFLILLLCFFALFITTNCSKNLTCCKIYTRLFDQKAYDTYMYLKANGFDHFGDLTRDSDHLYTGYVLYLFGNGELAVFKEEKNHSECVLTSFYKPFIDDLTTDIAMDKEF